ncbi:unnamed protein product [Bursaphelenchus okinawaensis]|uniref:DH domain-containing protein n=1 Tax=Bursaphelenchus okinawaensis TaxID=465554 RepID=A0A811L905_9BILA|nr:unnamed protein product [Bursaphelenchus okinawaensis]CAG9118734.1 unnamed protein product [Bursaphelenchus okinawaensis]
MGLKLATDASYFIAKSKELFNEISVWKKNLEAHLYQDRADQENQELLTSTLLNLQKEKQKLVAEIKKHGIQLILSNDEPVIDQLEKLERIFIELEDASEELLELANQTYFLETKFKEFSVDSYSKYDAADNLRAEYKDLLDSEFDYIADLGKCVDYYLKSYRLEVSPQKTYDVFGNIEAIYEFHQKEVLPQLTEYEKHPEDVGACFSQFKNKLMELYSEYCLNKVYFDVFHEDETTKTMLEAIRVRYNLPPTFNVQSLLDKPYQHLTNYQLFLWKIMILSEQDTKEVKEVVDAMDLMQDECDSKEITLIRAYIWEMEYYDSILRK